MVEIRVDTEKCAGCGDCVLICPVGVYEMRRENRKLKSFPADVASCCGLSCRVCMDTCWKTAIHLSE